MAAYYNEFNPTNAACLRELIADGLIADGVVDERSITDVTAADLIGFQQVHLYAGIGIWSHSLRLAGVPDHARVWTMSHPCQPFSEIGSQLGFADERHLWPVTKELIRVCRPAVIFGEQSEKAIGYGWLDLVQDDLEHNNFAFGTAGLPACSIGAPHIRKRTWFVGHTNGARLERYARDEDRPAGWPQPHRPTATPGSVNGYWADAEWRDCRDGKQRPIKPGVSPLAYVDSTTMGGLHAAGNAIVAELACVFIEAAAEAINGV